MIKVTSINFCHGNESVQLPKIFYQFICLHDPIHMRQFTNICNLMYFIISDHILSLHDWSCNYTKMTMFIKGQHTSIQPSISSCYRNRQSDVFFETNPHRKTSTVTIIFHMNILLFFNPKSMKLPRSSKHQRLKPSDLETPD